MAEFKGLFIGLVIICGLVIFAALINYLRNKTTESPME